MCATSAPRDNVTIRSARRKDAFELATLVTEAFKPAKADGPFRALLRYVERGDLASQFAARSPPPSPIKNPRPHTLLLAEHEDEILGCVEIGLLPSPSSIAEGDIARVWANLRETAGKTGRKGTPYIGNLAVKPNHRRRGVASRLVDAAEREASDWGAISVSLHVDARNADAQTLYRRRGYSCRVREPAWYPAIGRTQRLFLYKDISAQVKAVDDWDNAPVAHTRPLSAWEYIRWCIYDLQKDKTK